MCCSLRAASRQIGLALSLVLGLVLLVPSHVSAQAVTGTLLGNVNDSSGGADQADPLHHTDFESRRLKAQRQSKRRETERLPRRHRICG